MPAELSEHGVTGMGIYSLLPVALKPCADPMLNAWDAAAVAVVVGEAGGTFTDWQGIHTIDGGDGLATNGSVHNDLLRLLAPAAIRSK